MRKTALAAAGSRMIWHSVGFWKLKKAAFIERQLFTVRPAWAITWWCKSTTRSVAGSVS